LVCFRVIYINKSFINKSIKQRDNGGDAGGSKEWVHRIIELIVWLERVTQLRTDWLERQMSSVVNIIHNKFLIYSSIIQIILEINCEIRQTIITGEFITQSVDQMAQ